MFRFIARRILQSIVTILIIVSVAFLIVGSYLFTGMTATTSQLVISAWMLVLGIGIGPTLAAFTIVVQNAVPFTKLGVATSNLTFFRQIGGVVGLSIGGTIFGNVLRDQVPVQLAAAGVPPQVVAGFQGSAFDPNSLVGVGGNLGQSILASVPAQARPMRGAGPCGRRRRQVSARAGSAAR